MKILFYVSVILMITLSLIQCQEIEEEDAEEVEPVTVDTNNYEDNEDEDTTASDLDLIPPLNDEPVPPKQPRRPSSGSPRSLGTEPKRARGFSDIPTDLKVLATDVHDGTLGMFGRAREDLVTRMVLMGDKINRRQQRIANHFQSGLGGILGGLGGVSEGDSGSRAGGSGGLGGGSDGLGGLLGTLGGGFGEGDLI